MYPINLWIGDNFFGGEDNSGQIFSFNVYILWPFFIIFGGFIGHKVYKKMSLVTKKKRERYPIPWEKYLREHLIIW